MGKPEWSVYTVGFFLEPSIGNTNGCLPASIDLSERRISRRTAEPKPAQLNPAKTFEPDTEI